MIEIRDFFYLREGISQADVLAHSFDAAREREKLAKRVSTRSEKEAERWLIHILGMNIR